MFFYHLLCIFFSYHIFGDSLEGSDFVDFFEQYQSDHWKKDMKWRHCNSVHCTLATEDNLQYISHKPLQSKMKSNELLITMRNDCIEDFCCKDETHCTSYTSGHITSQHSYGYGSFDFDLRVEKKSKGYFIDSTSYKSVECTSSPKPKDFPHILKDYSGRGFCVNDNADLFEYSSNQDLCDGSDRNICARYSWIIYSDSPGLINFKSRGKKIDLTRAAVFDNGNLVSSGDRTLVQDFDVELDAAGRHRIELFGYENCCSGNHQLGYLGWRPTRVMKFTGVIRAWKALKKVLPKSVIRCFPGHGSKGLECATEPPSEENTTSNEQTTEEALQTTGEEMEVDLTLIEDYEEDEYMSLVLQGRIEEARKLGGTESKDPGGPSGHGNDKDKPLPDTGESYKSLQMPYFSDPEDLWVAITVGIGDALGLDPRSLQVEIDLESGQVDVQLLVNIVHLETKGAFALAIRWSHAMITSNALYMSVPQTATEDDLKVALTYGIAKAMDVKEEDLEVTVDVDTGTVNVRLFIHFGREGTSQEIDLRHPVSPHLAKDISVKLEVVPEDEISTSDVEYTTSEISTTSTSDPDPGVAVPSDDNALLCVLLVRTIWRYVRSVFIRISWCFSSRDSKQATLMTTYGDETFKEVVDLPFDASSKIGHYTIDWFPDHIIWKVDKEPIAELRHDLFSIPDSPMHIKMFVIPDGPIQNRNAISHFTEHQLHVHSAGYLKHESLKTELFVIGRSENSDWVFAILLPMTLILLFWIVWRFRKIKEKTIPNGYRKL